MFIGIVCGICRKAEMRPQERTTCGATSVRLAENMNGVHRLNKVGGEKDFVKLDSN